LETIRLRNDYFPARYYTSNYGRFLSPDPGWSAAGDVLNPQSWNQYSYAMNNALSWVDPTGMDCVTDNGDGTVSYNTGDCANENEQAANHEYYIDCDGCTSGAAGATLDMATGSLYLTDASGNGIAGTTVQGFADPDGTPSTTVTVNGYAPYLDTSYGYGIPPDIDSERIQQLALGVTRDSQHSFSCIAQAYGVGAPGETARYMGQPVANTKRFITPGTSIGTSPLSDFARGLPRVSGSFRAPVGGPGTGRAFQMARTGSLGVAAARYAPFVGLAADAVSVGQLYNCLGH
jgi:RHS repeat-associated protein